MSAIEIRRELRADYDQNIMSEGNLGQCYRMFKNGPTNFHYEELSFPPSVVNDEFLQSVNQKFGERRRFTISDLLC
jgi:hypothetical protein